MKNIEETKRLIMEQLNKCDSLIESTRLLGIYGKILCAFSGNPEDEDVKVIMLDCVEMLANGKNKELKSWQQSVEEGMESTIDYLEGRIKMDETSEKVMKEDIRIEEILDNIVNEVAELRKLTCFFIK